MITKNAQGKKRQKSAALRKLVGAGGLLTLSLRPPFRRHTKNTPRIIHYFLQKSELFLFFRQEIGLDSEFFFFGKILQKGLSLPFLGWLCFL